MRLTNLVKVRFPKINLKVAYKAPASVGGLFGFKDKSPRELLSNIVYQLTCKDCGKRYIGKTTRNICIRLEEHINVKSDSSVRKHIVDSGHTMDLNWSLQDKANNNQKLLLKEMLHINKYKPELKIQEQSELFSLLIAKSKINKNL